ncbi:MAG TPA: ATP-binding protein [Thermoleophilaceae bacterium]|nr:ATP-binding protein [Thermoleophilaceae bacterium]
MIEELFLENFRGFERHQVPFRAATIMVGGNNAGKSTIVEALRLLALVSDRFRRGTGRFVEPPDWLDHPEAYEGIAPAVRGMPADGFEPSVFHRYGPAPAILSARFSSGAVVTVFVGPDAQVHGVARKPDGAPVTRASAGKYLGIDRIAVQPQVAPLLREEPIRREETVRRGDGTYLAPQHFRNQLWLYEDEFDDFVDIAEATWTGLQVTELEGDDREPTRPLQLRVRDADFVGEVSLMGHGLQMWLQIVWFLARAPADAIVVLDEPDVYMHPDLQRKLLDLVRRRFRQLVIATHSVEIISDVEPGSILAVNRRQYRSTFVTSLPGLQEVVDGIGSVQNVQVTRLMRAESFFLVEGKDVKLLRLLQEAADSGLAPIDILPHARLGGRGGWGSGVPGRLPTTNAEGGNIRSFALLDRDYFPADEVNERYAEARRWKVQLRVWSRKELENFLLVPAAISRHIATRAAPAVELPSAEDVTKETDRIVDDMRESISDAMATLLFARDKSGGLTKANRAARASLDSQWDERATRWALAPGKEVLRRLAAWSEENFSVGLGTEAVARELRPDEVAPEVVEVISAIVEARPFRSPFAMPR